MTDMDLLNEIVKKNIEEYEISSMSELQFQVKCANIILSHPKNFGIPKYKKKYTFEESFYLSYSFLESINSEYAARLLKRQEEGAFIVDYREVAQDDAAISNIIDGKPKIYIPFRDTLDCSYAITHEFIHDMTIDGGFNDTRTIFCEVLSIYAELLQSQYFEKLQIKEAIVRPRKIFDMIYFKTLNMSLELELIKLYLDRGYIKPSDTQSILKKYNYNKDLIYSLYFILNEQELSFGLEQRYVYGYLLALYMMDKAENSNGNHTEFFELNEMMNTYKVYQFMEYLELEYISDEALFNLSDESYKKLEKHYVNQLKRIR